MNRIYYWILFYINISIAWGATCSIKLRFLIEIIGIFVCTWIDDVDLVLLHMCLFFGAFFVS